MKKILNCRRSMIAVWAISCLTLLGYLKAAEVAASIASIAIAIGAANAYEGVRKPTTPEA